MCNDTPWVPTADFYYRCVPKSIVSAVYSVPSSRKFLSDSQVKYVLQGGEIY